MNRYKEMIRQYFKVYKRGTVWDIIAWLKTERRVKKGRGRTPKELDRGLLVPTVVQVGCYMRKLGAKKVARVKLRPGLWVPVYELKTR